MSKGISVTGKKAYQCLDDYETYEIGSVIEPWTFIQDRIGYYTEGNPLVTNERPFNGTKSLSIKKGKIELMFDWGGVWNDGYYTISSRIFRAKRGLRPTARPVKLYSDFGIDDTVQGTGEWVQYNYQTGLLKAGDKFKMVIDSREDDDILYVDNLSIEYAKE